MAPQLEALLLERPFLRLRRIDIKSWESDVAKRYDIESLPQVWLYNGKERMTTDKGRAIALARSQH